MPCVLPTPLATRLSIDPTDVTKHDGSQAFDEPETKVRLFFFAYRSRDYAGSLHRRHAASTTVSPRP